VKVSGCYCLLLLLKLRQERKYSTRLQVKVKDIVDSQSNIVMKLIHKHLSSDVNKDQTFKAKDQDKVNYNQYRVKLEN